MPGNTSNYWSSMDFGSEEDESPSSKAPSTRVYVDPWDLENYAFMRRHLDDTPDPESPSSPDGEPTSSSFYYIPSNLDYRRNSTPRTMLSSESPTVFAGIDEVDFHNDNFEVPSDQGIYYHQPYDDFPHERKFHVPRPSFTDTGSSLSSGHETYMYTATEPRGATSPDTGPSLMSVYEAGRRRKLSLPKQRRASSQGRPLVKKFRRIRNINCPDCQLLEEAGYVSQLDMAPHIIPPITKPPPENFGLSQYGHLKIDYSCSWHSLDQLISHDN